MRRAPLLLLVGVMVPAAASGQPPPILFTPGGDTGFLSRVTAAASVEVLDEQDPGFHWDADFAIGVDFVDFGRGRVNVAFNYETVMGDDLQPFDPRQGNYTIDTLGTLRQGRLEVGLLLHHVSRHLGDRAKDFGIAWNDLGLVVVHTGTRGPWLWQARGLVAKTVLHDFVDYRGDAGGSLAVRRAVGPRLSIIASAGGHARFVAGAHRSRGTQGGGRVELGLRVQGHAAALEVVGGAGRRVDADPFEFSPRQWIFAGLRVVTP